MPPSLRQLYQPFAKEGVQISWVTRPSSRDSTDANILSSWESYQYGIDFHIQPFMLQQPVPVFSTTYCDGHGANTNPPITLSRRGDLLFTRTFVKFILWSTKLLARLHSTNLLSQAFSLTGWTPLKTEDYELRQICRNLKYNRNIIPTQLCDLRLQIFLKYKCTF